MNNQQQNHNTPIHLPGKIIPTLMETVIFRKLTCRPPTTPLLKFPWNFQEMILKFNQSFNNLQMQKSSLSVIDKELFLCRRWESNPQGISTTRT